jgi:tRNA threonylcarbamoyladenosine biosynthesis protein TsaE
MRAPEPTTTTRSAAETEAIGARLAVGLQPGDVVLLTGEMGTGKTTLVRGALRALGVTRPVTSPTFTLGHRYDEATPPASHLDLHRLASLDDEDPGLLEDYVGPGRIAFVEWPQVAAPVLAGLGRIASRVTLEHAGEDARRVTVS